MVRRNCATRTGHGEKIPFLAETCVQRAAHVATAEAFRRASAPQRPQEARVSYACFCSFDCIVPLGQSCTQQHPQECQAAISSVTLVRIRVRHMWSLIALCRPSSLNINSFAMTAAVPGTRGATPCAPNAKPSTRAGPARGEKGNPSFARLYFALIQKRGQGWQQLQYVSAIIG